jgi:hypothetical protein
MLATKLDAFMRGKYPNFSVSTNVNGPGTGTGNDLLRSVTGTGWFKRDEASDPNFAFYMDHPLFFWKALLLIRITQNGRRPTWIIRVNFEGACCTTLTFPLTQLLIRRRATNLNVHVLMMFANHRP